MPVDVAYAYLADPRNRPEWQSSLRARRRCSTTASPAWGCAGATSPARASKPEMVITEMQRGIRWAETGTWRAIEAELVLDFSPRISSERTGCLVVASFGVHGRGLLRPVGWGATLGRPARGARRPETCGEDPRRPGGGLMGRIVGLVLAVLMVLVGVLWTLQGLDVIKGSSMSGQHYWALVGPALAGFGLALGIVAFRGARPPGGRR